MPRKAGTAARSARDHGPADSVGGVTISDSGRREAPLTRLARLGFTDPQAALTLLDDPAVDAAHLPDLLDSLADVADPDLALWSLARVLQAGGGGLRHDIYASPWEWRRLLAVLGSSVALGDHLVRHPEHHRSLADDEATNAGAGSDLRSALLAAVGADSACGEPLAGTGGLVALDALRVAYRRELIAIAGRDLTAEIDLEQTAGDLSDLAAAALDAGLAIARADLPPDVPRCRLAVIGMGKVGGRELNYVSDVDVVFVAEPEAGLRTASALAAGLMRACSATTAEGYLWPVAAAPRPDGNAGASVRTVGTHQAYYQRWAKTWEFQALLKARPVAGDLALGQAYIDAVG